MHERFTRHTADNYNEMLHTRFRLCFVLYIYKYIHLIDGKRTSHAHQPPDSLFSFSQIPSSICENARPDQPVMVFRCRKIEFRIIGNVSLQNREYFTFWLWRREATRARSIDWRRRWRKCNSVTIDVLRMNAAGALLLSVISIPCFLLLLLFFYVVVVVVCETAPVQPCTMHIFKPQRRQRGQLWNRILIQNSISKRCELVRVKNSK